MSGGGHSAKPHTSIISRVRDWWWWLWKAVMILSLLNLAVSEIKRLIVPVANLGTAGTIYGLGFLCFGMFLNWLFTGEKKPLFLSLLLLAGVLLYLWFISSGNLDISFSS